MAFTQFPLHTDAEFVKSGVEQSLDCYEAFSDKFMTFFRGTRTKESECELAAHIIVSKAIKTTVDMFVAQLEQYRQTEKEERDPGPSSVEADHLGVEIKQEISYPDKETSHLSKAKARFEAARTQAKYAELAAKIIKEKAQLEEDEAIAATKIAREIKDLDISLNLITLQQKAEEAEVELEALVESMSMPKH